MTEKKKSLGARQFFVFGVILYFTFIGGTFYSDLNFYLRVFNQVVVTLLLASWLVLKIRRSEPFPPTSLDGPILAWLVAHLVAAIFGLSPRFSLEKLWTPFTYAIAFYLLVELHRKGKIETVARGLYMSAAVVCLVGLFEFASWYFGLELIAPSAQGWASLGGLQHPFPPTLYRLNFTLNGATPLSAYLALLIPPALGIWLTTRNRDDRQAIALWLGLAVIVEGLSFSRGGVLALLVSLPLTILGWRLARRHQGTTTTSKIVSSSRKPLLFGTMAIILLAAVLIAPTWLKHTFDRSYSTQFRFTLWKAALTSFEEHPLTGVGPYNFGRSLLRRNDPNLPRRQISTAHNVYLNSAAELGLIGLLAGGWLLLATTRAWLNRWRGASNAAERIQIAATGAALTGLAAHSLVDTFAATPNVLPMLALAAFTLSDPETSAADHRYPSIYSLLPRLALVGLTLYALGLAWLDGGQFHFQRSVNLAGQGNLSGAIEAARQARQIDPPMPLYTFQQAYLQGNMTDSATASGAAELYRAGLKAEPVEGRQTANLAAVLWQAGNREEAIKTLARAVEVDPDPMVLINLGYFHQQRGNVNQAARVYAQALALSPELAGSRFWQADVERAAHWPQIESQAETILAAEESDLTRWRLAAASAQGDWGTVGDYAWTILQDEPQDCAALAVLARARFEAGQVEEARGLAQRAIDFDRACGGAYLVRGSIHQSEADPYAAERDWRTALFLGQRRAAYHLGKLYEMQGDTSQAGEFYIKALSLRAVPIDIEVILYDRRATFDLLPPLFHIGISPEEAEPWLALARLQEAQGDPEAARHTLQTLLSEDPYLEIAQERLKALSGGE